MEPSHPRRSTGKLFLSLGIVLVAAALCYVGFRNATIGKIQKHALPAPQGQPYFVTISPNGDSVAMTELVVTEGKSTSLIEVQDVESGRLTARTTFPKHPSTTGPKYSVQRPLKYCDRGKYLMAFDGDSTLYVLDARTLETHTSFALNALQLYLDGAPTTLGWGDLNSIYDLQVDCSAESDVAAVQLDLDHSTSIKMLSLDEGTESDDLTNGFDGSYGAGLAVSPDGSQLAIYFMNLGRGTDGKVEGAVEVVDTHTRNLQRKISLGAPRRVNGYQLTFAGEKSLVIEELESHAEKQDVDEQASSGRMLQLFDLGEGGGEKVLRARGDNAYRFSGASADGREVFAYTGNEAYCWFCNRGHGEVKIWDARFTVWDSASGRVIARSSALKVKHHQCTRFSAGGCQGWEQLPQLEMSQNGKSVVAFWRSDANDPNDRVPGELAVFTKN